MSDLKREGFDPFWFQKMTLLLRSCASSARNAGITVKNDVLQDDFKCATWLAWICSNRKTSKKHSQAKKTPEEKTV